MPATPEELELIEEVLEEEGARDLAGWHLLPEPEPDFHT